MDSLDISYLYNRKILDLQNSYDQIEEVEIGLDEVQFQIRSICQEKVSGDNIYRLLMEFNKVYGTLSKVEKKNL